MHITVAVEGPSDAAVARRIVQAAGLQVSAEFVAGGKKRLDPRIRGYNNAARFGAWLVLRDLDFDAECAATLREALLPAPAPGMHLRVPVRSVEAWLLADRENFSRYFGVSPSIIAGDPDSLPRPKRTIVDLARRSAKRAIREGVVPVEGTSAEVGPGFTAVIVEYASTVWAPDAAAEVSDSLRRCLRALRQLSSSRR